MKTCYVLRCFYGESLRTGEDLKVDLRISAKAISVVAVIICFLCLSNNQARANPESAGTTTSRQTASFQNDLDQSIEKTISKREYMWRLPREEGAVPDEAKDGVFASFMRNIGETVKNMMSGFRDIVRKGIEWIDKILRGRQAPSSSSAKDFSTLTTTTQIFIFILIGAIASVLVIMFMRMWKRRSPKEVINAEAVPVSPDLTDENVAANQLPEDGWLKLARELMEKGDLRLALRALYLASLAHLAHRDMVTIAKFKSNRDYERELRRRARSLPELQTAFAQNVTVFDRVWYGMHEVSSDSLQSFEANLERIRAC